MIEHQDVRTSTVALVGLVGLMVVSGIVLSVQLLYYRMSARQTFVKQTSQAHPELADMTARQQLKLGEPPGWIDQKKGVVHLPIDAAMRRVVDEYAAGKVDKPVAKPTEEKPPAERAPAEKRAAEQDPSKKPAAEKKSPTAAGESEANHAK